MEQRVPTQVYGKDGLSGEIVSDPSMSGHDVVIRLNDGRHISVDRSLLQPDRDGRYYLPYSLAEMEATERRVIPVIEESLQVDRRQVETGRTEVRKRVHARTETVDEPVIRDEVVVEHVPVNRIVDEAFGARTEGDTTIIPLFEEVIIVQKQLLLKEEVHITRRRETVREPQTVVLRSEQVEIERSETDRPTRPTGE